MKVCVRVCCSQIVRILVFVGLFSALSITPLSARLACPCTLTWDASTSPSTAGYAVYYGVSGSTVTNRLDVGIDQSATMYNLTAASNYFFFVVAYDSNGAESEPSNLLEYTPSAMSSLKLAALVDGSMRLNFRAGVGTSCRVEFTDSLGAAQWTFLETVVADSNGDVVFNDPPAGRPDSRFYRAVLP